MTLRYPMDMNINYTDYVTITHFEYETNSPAQPLAPGGQRRRPPAAANTNAIVLYVPNSTPSMAQTNDWGDVTFEGPLGALKKDTLKFVGDTAMGTQFTGTDGVLSSAENARTQGNAVVDKFKAYFDRNMNLETGEGAAKQMLIGSIAGMASMSPSQLLALSRGQAYNPNVELLYKAPKLRQFSLSYSFLPKSEAENAAVNRIIMECKKWSAPALNDNGMFELPHLWQVTYMTGGKQNPHMNAFKPAALTSVAVVDNPSSTMHSSHPGGAPVERIMKLDFSEVDIITRGEHDEAGNEVGY